MSHSTDIVAYAYEAEIYCPSCIARMWRRGKLRLSEDTLDRAAECIGIDRMDESSFDSGEFPKVVFSDQVNDEHYDHCGSCHECIDHDPEDHPTGEQL